MPNMRHIRGGEMLLPNVSYCKDNNEVHYNPYVQPTTITVVYNVSEYDVEVGCSLFVASSVDEFISVEIDDIKHDPEDLLHDDYGVWHFDTTGEHTVIYTLSNGASCSGAFTEVSDIKSFTISEGLETYGSDVFYQYGETPIKLIFPSTIKSIGYVSFIAYGENELVTSITVKATIPPTIIPGETFIIEGVPPSQYNFPLYVPAESVEAYKSASGWSTYASRIRPITV